MSISIKSLAGKILKVTGLSIVGILVILFLAPVVFPGHIAEKVKNFANKSLDGELNFSKARLSFFSHFPSLTLTLSDFSLKGSAPFKKDTLVSTKKIGFGINLKSLLFNKRIDIDKIFIDDAIINVQVNKNGEANYNVYVPAKKSKVINKADTAGTSLKLEKIVIRNSYLVYKDQSTSILLNAKGFNYTGNGDLSKAIFDLNSHAEIDSLDFYFEDQPYLVNKKIDGNLITSINTNSFAFSFQRDHLVINKLPVEFSGRLNFLENGYDMDFKVTAVKANLDDLVTALPPQFVTWEQKTKIKGNTDMLLTLKGKYISSLNTMPDLAFNMQLRDGYIAYEGAPFPVTALFLNLDTKMPSVNPDSLKVKVDSIFFKIDDNYLSAVINTLGMSNPFINAKMDAKMDLEKFDKALGLSTIDLKGNCEVKMTMNGKYSSRIKSNTTKESVITSIPVFDLKATLKDGYFRYTALPIPVTNINLDIKSSCPDSNYQHAGFSINNIAATAHNSFVKGNISVSSLYEMMVNANLQSVVNMADLKNIYPVKGLELGGLLRLNLSAKGKYDTVKKTFPVTRADLSLQNAIIKTSYYPHPISDIHLSAKVNDATGSLKDLKININPASFKFEGEPFQLQASLQDLQDISYDVKANGKIDIAKIYKVFAQQGQDITGFIDANLSLQGKQSDAMKGRYNKLNNHGTLAIRDIKASSDNFPKPFFIKEGLFRFNQDKMWFTKFLADYGHSDFQLDGYLQDVIGYAISKNASLKGNFKMHANLLDVDEFMAFAPAKKTSDNTIAKGQAAASKPAGVVIVPSDLDVSLNATATKVSYSGLNLENATANIAIEKSKIALTKTGFTLVGCNVLMDAVYGSVTARKAFFETHLVANDFDIKRAYNEVKLFHDMATAAANAEGIISVDYSLKGSLDDNMQPVYPSLEGSGVVSVKNVKMKGFKLLSAVGNKTGKDGIKDPELSKINIKSTIKNNVINIEQFKIKTAGFRLRIEGKTNFDGALQMKMRLGLPPLGIIGIPMHVTGTQENPVIKLGRGDKDENVEETEDQDDEKKVTKNDDRPGR